MAHPPRPVVNVFVEEVALRMVVVVEQWTPLSFSLADITAE
jgi:hypothetical protein